MEKEGVIKYTLNHDLRPIALPGPFLAALNLARDQLVEYGMIGQDASRYEGYGFGNISLRVPATQRYWISGTQTGHLEKLSACDISEVTNFDASQNNLQAIGETKPSSESLSHGVLYGLDERISAVVHAHAPLIWHNAERLDLVGTDAGIAYGTPEMASAITSIAEVLIKKELPCVFAMFGHEDGVIAAGEDLQSCTKALIGLQKKLKSHTTQELG